MVYLLIQPIYLGASQTAGFNLKIDVGLVIPLMLLTNIMKILRLFAHYYPSLPLSVCLEEKKMFKKKPQK